MISVTYYAMRDATTARRAADEFRPFAVSPARWRAGLLQAFNRSVSQCSRDQETEPASPYSL
eukprot:6204421-Pleurochrysis_carterae.AAC.1